MQPDWEDLLRSGGLDVPPDFTARVLHHLPPQQQAPGWKWALALIAALAAAALGLTEIMAAIFAAWTMSAAF